MPKVILVIETTEELVGDGKIDPYRRPTKYYSLDGELLATHDPWWLGEAAKAMADKEDTDGKP